MILWETWFSLFPWLLKIFLDIGSGLGYPIAVERKERRRMTMYLCGTYRELVESIVDDIHDNLDINAIQSILRMKWMSDRLIAWNRALGYEIPHGACDRSAFDLLQDVEIRL